MIASALVSHLIIFTSKAQLFPKLCKSVSVSDAVRLKLEDRESGVGLRPLGGPRRQGVQCGDFDWVRKVPPHRDATEGAAAPSALSSENPRGLWRRRRGLTVVAPSCKSGDGCGNVEEGEADDR